MPREQQENATFDGFSGISEPRCRHSRTVCEPYLSYVQTGTDAGHSSKRGGCSDGTRTWLGRNGATFGEARVGRFNGAGRCGARPAPRALSNDLARPRLAPASVSHLEVRAFPCFCVVLRVARRSRARIALEPCTPPCSCVVPRAARRSRFCLVVLRTTCSGAWRRGPSRVRLGLACGFESCADVCRLGGYQGGH